MQKDIQKDIQKDMQKDMQKDIQKDMQKNNVHWFDATYTFQLNVVHLLCMDAQSSALIYCSLIL